MAFEEQKYALITGASSGIGYSMAKALSKRRYKVLGCSPSHDSSQMDPLVKEYGIIAFDCDITNLKDIQRCKEIVQRETGGKLDILYNNGGIAIGGPAIEIDEKQLDKIFQVNVIGHINMTKHMADFVIAAKGTIVFTSSVASIVPLSWIAAYNSTKAAIDMYAKTLHAEMKPFGVKVYSVITGGVNTSIGITGRKNVDQEKAWKETHYQVDGMRESVESTSDMASDKITEDPDVYAEGIANKLTSNKDYGFNLYKGGQARTLHYLRLLLPLCVLQFFISLHFKQLAVFRNIRKNRQKKHQ